LGDLAQTRGPSLARFKVGAGVRVCQCECDDPSDSERRQHDWRTAGPGSYQENPEKRQHDGEKDAVVDAREHLQPHQHTDERAQSPRAFGDRAVQRPVRQRHPHRPLQFQVHEVLDAIRHEREDRGRDEGGASVLRQKPDEHEDSDARRDDAREKEDVVHEHR
jgi:hypothetical protein